MQNAILLVSFGTSNYKTFKKTLNKLIKKVENNFSNFKIYIAFTSNIIIKKLKENHNIKIDTVSESLDKILKDGFKDLIIQPLFIINGIENNLLHNIVKTYKKHFHSIKVGNPLLSSNKDYINLIEALKNNLPFINYNENVILMGHGSYASFNNSYIHLNNILKRQGYSNIHLTTLEGNLKLSNTINKLKNKKVTNVYLVPIMLFCGKHILYDMNGNKEYSLKSILENNNFTVNCILKGLLEYDEIQDIFIEHLKLSCLDA